jgi:hypothetical protein
MNSWKNLYATIKRPTTYVVFSPPGYLDQENAFEPHAQARARRHCSADRAFVRSKDANPLEAKMWG